MRKKEENAGIKEFGGKTKTKKENICKKLENKCKNYMYVGTKSDILYKGGKISLLEGKR